MSLLYVDNVINKTSLYSLDGAYGAEEVWVDKPSAPGTILYSVITPAICFFGIVANFLCCLVLCRKELQCSCFSYLAAVAIMDLANCIVTFISGLSLGALWHIPGWTEYDALICIPLGSIFSSISVTAIVAVTYDRIMYLSQQTCTKKTPKYCNRTVARKVMFATGLIAILINAQYCFIFEFNEYGKLQTTKFFKSTLYYVLNWGKFIIYSIIPGFLLVVGNCILIGTVNRTLRKKRILCKRLKKPQCESLKNQVRLTLTLVAMIFMFFIGYMPATIVSRKTAVTILYEGDYVAAESSYGLELLRQIATVLYAINISVNFVFYIYLCPKFNRSLKSLLRGKRGACPKRKTTNVQAKVQVNVFVLGGKGTENRFIGDIVAQKTGKLFDILKDNDKEDDDNISVSVSNDLSNRMSSTDVVFCTKKETCGK